MLRAIVRDEVDYRIRQLTADNAKLWLFAITQHQNAVAGAQALQARNAVHVSTQPAYTLQRPTSASKLVCTAIRPTLVSTLVCTNSWSLKQLVKVPFGCWSSVRTFSASERGL